MTDLETREKIMEAATVLFADHGYEGTSVREIAKAADVNVASVNYYFNSKENLFLEIMKAGFVECSLEMKELLEKNKGELESTMIDCFRYFLENSHNLRSHFKLMLSSQHSHHLVSEGTEDSIYGPPGGMVMAGAIKNLAPSASDRDVHWALRTLFSHIVHTSIIHSTCIKSNTQILFCSQLDLEEGIRRLTRMVIKEITNPQPNTNNP
jgi:AcrR family transcriptional regulator